MPGDLILRHCSPTLAGLKIGNIFNYQFDNLDKLSKELDKWNRELNVKGIYLISIKVNLSKAMILVYRESFLLACLKDKEVQEFLKDYGYLSYDLNNALEYLKIRLENQDQFPHEIGVFLGYPLEDIKCFIKNKGFNCKCIGCWKVYNNEDKAKQTFHKYNLCKDNFLRRYQLGSKVLELTVSL